VVTAVKGASQSTPPTTSASGLLPVTGSRAGILVATGVLLLGAGLALLALRRRSA
jgi:LPXTG-motif cell wall-anchored protein